MEIFELRYFLEVAKHENIHRASEKLHVSPGSLSKAVSRIEAELGVRLFEREGRNIRLTNSGRVLKIRGSQIVQLEEAARFELAGSEGGFLVALSGPEVLLSKFGVEVARHIGKRFPLASFEFHACGEKAVIDQVREGETHFGLITQDSPAGVTAKILGEASFVTVVGPGHPLYKKARSATAIAVEEVIEHGFVSPNQPFLGQVGLKQSLDGWRDDKFKRKIAYLSSSLKLIEELVRSGAALAYLPEYLIAQASSITKISVRGCPYTCNQKIRLITRAPIDLGWIKQVF